MLIEFQSEIDAREYAKLVEYNKSIVDTKVSKYSLPVVNVMLLAGEGDEEDNEANVDVDEPAGEHANA